MSQIRRRHIQTKADEGIPVLYPSRVMFKCRTTSANQSVNLAASGAWSRRYINIIIDDVPVSGAQEGGITIAEPGDHTVYCDVNWINYGSWDSCIYYVRLPNKSLKDLFVYGYDGSYNGIEIDCLRSTPPCVINSDQNALSKASVIRIPAGSLSAYAAAAVWGNYTSKMVEVNYKIIE